MRTAAKKPVATFDEAAKERLEVLLKKRKEGHKFTVAETFELRELLNLRAETRCVKKRAAIAEGRRRHDDRTKYRLGSLALAAGLQEWPDDLLTAGFASLARMSDEQKADLLSAAMKVDIPADVAAADAAPTVPEPGLGLDDMPLPARPQATLGMLMNDHHG